MAARSWTCQRVADGVRCGYVNPRRKVYCEECGKRRPAALDRPSKATHIADDYESYVERQGGEFCGICGRGRPASGNRLHRDHDHKTGEPRGLLCFNCNRQLPAWATLDWMRRAVAYLERYATR